MHDHNDNNGGMGAMMWMMVICCAVPFLFLLFGATLTGAWRWAILGVAAVFMMWHFQKMRQGSCHSTPNQTTDPKATVTVESKPIDHNNR